MARTLFKKVWDTHAVRTLPNGQTQLYIGLHLVHEVTSPQAFAELRERGWGVRAPQRTFATIDHIVPTAAQARPFTDVMAESMTAALERNCRDYGIRFFDLASGSQGIVHVIGPEMGLTQPGMTIACGDSHTSTHGAFGAIAFGIGTSQVRDVLATQTMAILPLKVRRIEVNGHLRPGVFAKDVILHIIGLLGVKGGTGYAYEYAGEVIDRMSMDERMTICNMSIEGGARVGYVNPDETTFEFLRDRPYAPQGPDFDKAVVWWKAMASDPGAAYDDVVKINGADIAPTVTWGINPGQSVGVNGRLPLPQDLPAAERPGITEALDFMGFSGGQQVQGTRIDVAFIGSCTNGRLSDLREAALVVKGHHVAPHVRALVVPGSQKVAIAAEKEGLDRIFQEAGFEWRRAGCSMCLAMNPDRLSGREICASSSNRNFKGRQGSPTGRTLLMSPAMVAAAAVAGEVVDIRSWSAGVPRGSLGSMSRIEAATGCAVAVHGDDIDTDRIIPARFLKTITFEGLEDHVFEDDRVEARAQGRVHPFDDPAHKGAAILLGGSNFGCGSSREHAPQAIRRWGIGAVIAVSFAEIFYGNSMMIGLPCACVTEEQMQALMALADAQPGLEFHLDLQASTLKAGDLVVPVTMPESVRSALLSGDWDATALLLDRYEEVEQAAARLPYVSGWDRGRA